MMLKNGLRLAALLLGLGAMAGIWWTWWAVTTGHSLELEWWIELYIEPFVILLATCFMAIVFWEEVKLFFRTLK